MNAYNLRILKVIKIENLIKRAGKKIDVSLGYNKGFATVLWLYEGMNYPYIKKIKIGDKIEIPKASLVLNKSVSENGNVYYKLVIFTNYIEKIKDYQENKLIEEIKEKQAKEREFEVELDSERFEDFFEDDKNKDDSKKENKEEITKALEDILNEDDNNIENTNTIEPQPADDLNSELDKLKEEFDINEAVEKYKENNSKKQ